MSIWDPPQQQSQIQKEFRQPPPHDKIIKVTLLYFPVANAYKVMQIENTIWYKPGDWLDDHVVGEICKLEKWDVIIQYFDLTKMIFDLFSGKVTALVP